MSRGFLALSSCVLIALAPQGCGGTECGTGTLRYGDKCVVVDPFDRTAPKITVDPPLYTREVGTVRLTTDEPATIYYTIDGSEPTFDSPNEPDEIVIPNVPDSAQLRAFAVDLAGNQSDELSRLWIIDRSGPPAPDFHLAVSGDTRTVTWTPVLDLCFGGVVVARVEGVLGTSVVSGHAYAIGDTLGPGITIVQVTGPAATGTATFSETMPAQPGLIRYVAWAYDDILNYGPPAGDYVVVPMAMQTARISVTAATGVVAPVTQPANAMVSGVATLAGSTLTVKLSVRNETNRVWFAPKVMLTSALAGVTWSNSDGVVATLPYRAYGGALGPGMTTTTSWVFTGASSSTTLTLDLQLRDGFVFIANTTSTHSGEIVDAETGKTVEQLAAGPTGRGGRARTQRGGITPDGKVVVGARTAGSVSTFDLASGQLLVSTELHEQKAHVPQLVLDRSGVAVYALIALEHPNRVNGDGNGSATELVRLDAATLTETGRLALGTSRNRGLELSPDGKSLLVATGITSQGVILIDLATFSIKERILPGFRPQIALFSPDGASILVVNESVAVYNAITLARTTLYPTPGTGGKVHRAAFGAANILWIGRHSQLANIDLRTGDSQVFTSVPGAEILDVFDGKVFTGSHQSSPATIQRLSDTAVVETALPGFTSFKGHWIGRSPF